MILRAGRSGHVSTVSQYPRTLPRLLLSAVSNTEAKRLPPQRQGSLSSWSLRTRAEPDLRVPRRLVPGSEQYWRAD